MTLVEILSVYDVRDGTIVSPGKFEGCPVWAVHCWDEFMNGCADSDDGEVIGFDVTLADRLEFHDLETANRVILTETDSGFVYAAIEV